MRAKNAELYYDERERICTRLIDILQLDQNNTFLLKDLDEDIEKQQDILNLKDDIRQVFCVSKLAPYKAAECKRPYIIILRNILRMQGYTFEGKTAVIDVDQTGKLTTTTRYKIGKPV